MLYKRLDGTTFKGSVFHTHMEIVGLVDGKTYLTKFDEKRRPLYRQELAVDDDGCFIYPEEECMNLDDIIEYYENTGALGPRGYGVAELQLRTAELLKAARRMAEDLDDDYHSKQAWQKAAAKVDL